MDRTPEVTTLDDISRSAGYKSIEPVKRPSYWGVDREMSRRPGVPMMRQPPAPMPNAELHIPRMQGKSSAPKHNRTNRDMPPVFSTASPMKGLSGLIKRAAATMPDHKPQFWLLKLLSDRVDVWEHRLMKLLPIAVPALAAAYVVRRRQARASQRTNEELVVAYEQLDRDRIEYDAHARH